MTGLQLASFWEGNRAQLFATHVLSGVAAVVPVPVPMDFGHDLLCTLTRRDRHALYAGYAFGVQVKSKSDSDVHYGGLDDKGRWKRYELQWLYEQHLPLIICIVDLKQWTVELFSTHFKWWVLDQKGMPGEITLVPNLKLEDFSEADGRTLLNRYRSERLDCCQDGTIAGDGFRYLVPLGNPIVSVSVKEQEGTQFRDAARACFENWLGLEYRNLIHHQQNVPFVEEWLTWTTNAPPGPPAHFWHFHNSTPGKNIREILSSIAPALGSLAHNLNDQKQFEKLDSVRPMLSLLQEYDLLDVTLVNFLEGNK